MLILLFKKLVANALVSAVKANSSALLVFVLDLVDVFAFFLDLAIATLIISFISLVIFYILVIHMFTKGKKGRKNP